jgi:hypothetical protein
MASVPSSSVEVSARLIDGRAIAAEVTARVGEETTRLKGEPQAGEGSKTQHRLAGNPQLSKREDENSRNSLSRITERSLTYSMH